MRTNNLKIIDKFKLMIKRNLAIQLSNISGGEGRCDTRIIPGESVE